MRRNMGGTATSSTPLLQVPQITATYRFMPSSNSPWGFIAEVLQAGETTWKQIDQVPLFVIQNLLVQAGLLGGSAQGGASMIDGHASKVTVSRAI